MLMRCVERVYCKRPTLCLASSKILTPHPPHRPASVYPPPLERGEDMSRWVERGGVNILEDARHSSVLYICKYFVMRCSDIIVLASMTRVGGGGGGGWGLLSASTYIFLQKDGTFSFR